MNTSSQLLTRLYTVRRRISSSSVSLITHTVQIIKTNYRYATLPMMCWCIRWDVESRSVLWPS